MEKNQNKKPAVINKKLIKVLAVLLGVVVLVWGIWRIPWLVKVAESSLEPLHLPEGFTITAHAGALNTEDNSLESIKTSIDFILVQLEGSGILEVDVRFTADGTPVLAHNTVSAGKSYVTLAELFALLQPCPGIRVNLDLKEKTNLAEVCRLGQEYRVLPQLFFTGVGYDAVDLVRQTGGGIPYYLNADISSALRDNRDELNQLAYEMKLLGAVGLNISYRQASRLLVEVMHENDLLVSLWTVNAKDAMQVVLSMAPDNITTRNPDVLLGIIAERQQLEQPEQAAS